MLGHDFGIGSKNEKKIDTQKIKTVKHSAQYYLDIMDNLHHGLYLDTGHRLSQGENIYEPTHVEYTEGHRTTIVKELTRQELLNLKRNMEMMSDLLSSLSDIIHEKLKIKEK